jgi:DHA3 family tetracycline resistance protein-like MFS transporter
VRAYRVYLFHGAAIATFMQVIDPIVAVYYVRVVGLTPLQLVLVGMVSLVVGLIFEVPTGVVADLYSRKLSVVLGMACIGTCFLVQGLLPLLPAILAAEAVRGLGGTFVSGALDAWIADEIGEVSAARAYLRYAQIRQIGALLGTFVGTGLATIALGLPIAIGGVLILFHGLFLALAMPEQGFKRPVREASGGVASMVSQTRAGVRLIRGRRLLIALLGVWACLALASEGLDRLWEAHILAYFQLPSILDMDAVVWFGVVNAGFMVGSVVGTEIVRRTVDVGSHRSVATALLLFSALRIATLALFALAGSFYLAVAAYVATESFRRMSGPLFTGWVNRKLDPRFRATVLSMGGQVDAVGQLTGGPVVGLVGELLSLRAAMLTAAALLLPTLPLIARAGREAEREERALGA